MQPPHTDSVQWILEVEPKDIAYIVGTFEAYDGLAVVRTLDPKRGHIELMITPDFESDVASVVEALSREIPVQILSR
ncbi:hypothetical protein NITGR_250089 [Nitrospina gracilis 3/211]|uniref:DUF4911 domain-containing protein n=1 Tax=Nitrospina gracilis (strain 3/211) TaxID=1266370 RepID=M1YI88_NITG3|nr:MULTISPECIES: DUF4911 domain-containing protein [Nitrospina]MCF8723134.1 hypothetical protein [Nitrospina sp. Nb-3]CCQ90176.1 hypothetical protein NITGR_250089 [Nitrospina gracilis 3/211]